MKLAHAIIALVLCAIIIGLMAGAASAAHKVSPTVKPTIKHNIGGVDMSDKSYLIPRSTHNPTATFSVKPPVRVKHSLTLLAARVKPTASVRPTKIAHKASIGMLAVRASPKPTMKRSIKYLQALPQGVQTPAQSYGIYGLGGYVPTPTTAPAVRPIPSGSPTPVPGFYTPRYPGEAGAGNTLVIPPTPTPRPREGSPASAVSIPYANGGNSGRGTVGVCSCIGLSDDARYAGRGPGLFGSTIVQTPASAPGPNARPVAIVVFRRR